MKPLQHALAVIAFALASACTDQAVVDGQFEIAGELRALRVAMQQQQSTTQAAPPPVEFDRAVLATAMEPLREVLVGLVRDMDGMQTRQAALTDELKRWSQLLAQSATAGNQEEVQGLVSRLEQLEQQMSQQDNRHREVEALLIRALDSTADRLEDFLKRLGEIGPREPGAAPPETPAGTGDPDGPGEPDKQKTGTVDGPAPGKERLGASRWGARGPSAWWYGVAAAAVLLGGVFALWLGRENRAAAVRRLPEPAVNDDGVQQLWAAAALLGEAVGRLREQDADESPQTETKMDLDDLFVIDEDIEAPEAAAADSPSGAVVDTAPPPPENPAVEPYRVTLRLSATDPTAAMQRVLAVLTADARVLPRPEPAVAASGRWLEVRYFVLPQLRPGERANLELTVRDAVR